MEKKEKEKNKNSTWANSSHFGPFPLYHHMARLPSADEHRWVGPTAQTFPHTRGFLLAGVWAILAGVRGYARRIFLFLRRANRTSSIMAQFVGSVGVIRKPTSGGHKKGGAESLPPHLLRQCANNLNRTDLHHRCKNREDRDPPPSFSRLNAVGTLACDQD
jgi:hypothetical protein